MVIHSPVWRVQKRWYRWVLVLKHPAIVARVIISIWQEINVWHSFNVIELAYSNYARGIVTNKIQWNEDKNKIEAERARKVFIVPLFYEYLSSYGSLVQFDRLNIVSNYFKWNKNIIWKIKEAFFESKKCKMKKSDPEASVTMMIFQNGSKSRWS